MMRTVFAGTSRSGKGAGGASRQSRPVRRERAAMVAELFLLVKCCWSSYNMRTDKGIFSGEIRPLHVMPLVAMEKLTYLMLTDGLISPETGWMERF